MLAPLTHLGIIMDGNRRWAKDRGLHSFEGHRVGYERVVEIAEHCLARGIHVLSVFAFSTENWDRTQEEVGYLMDLLERALTKEVDRYITRGIRIRVLGRRERLRPSIVRAIDDAERRTASNTRVTLCICLNYGGKPEIVDACRRIVADGLTPEEVTEDALQSRMYWSEMPPPDLIIRTSGEERLSGFLTWHAAYSELYWTQKHWPDFDEAELDRALESYATRQRRFGK